jgi:hypothetical protein
MIDLRITGIGLWTPGVPDWSQARAALSGETAWPEPTTGRPAPTLMPANERRRAPESVLLAMTVAEQACAGAGVDAATLPSVFASIYGDLAINDYMCATLRDDPSAMSPIRFHNSVHNAPSGYWSIATGAMLATTSVAASRETFAAGLLEAACQVVERHGPVLLAAYDSTGTGPVARVSCVAQSFGCALLLDRATAPGPRLHLQVGAAAIPESEPRQDDDPGLAVLRAGNPIAAQALPLMRALATNQPISLTLPASTGLALTLDMTP